MVPWAFSLSPEHPGNTSSFMLLNPPGLPRQPYTAGHKTTAWWLLLSPWSLAPSHLSVTPTKDSKSCTKGNSLSASLPRLPINTKVLGCLLLGFFLSSLSTLAIRPTPRVFHFLNSCLTFKPQRMNGVGNGQQWSELCSVAFLFFLLRTAFSLCICLLVCLSLVDLLDGTVPLLMGQFQCWVYCMPGLALRFLHTLFKYTNKETEAWRG